MIASAPAHGMGFGRVASSTQLGQPLNFTSVVNLEGDESLTRDCVFAEVVAGDTRIAPSFVRVTLENGSGERERIVRVSTSTPIDEPVVAVSVSLGCASRTTRRFVEFIDPPAVALAQATPVAAESVAPAARGDAVTPSSTGAAPPETERGRRSVPTDAAEAQAPASRRSDVAATAPGETPRSPADPGIRRGAAPQRKPPAVRLASAIPRGTAAGARLQLDAPSVAVAAIPAASTPPAPAGAEATVAAQAPASAAEAAAQAELLAQERRRVRTLEDAVARLQADSQAQRQALAALQVRTRGTRSERYANPFVYTLAALCLLLTMTVCGLLGRRSRDRTAARWLTGPLPGEAVRTGRAAVPAEGATIAPLRATAELPLLPPVALAPVALAPVEGRAPPLSESVQAIVTTRPTGMSAPAPAAAGPANRASAEELVDLEQQADFFIVLGQDDAAIDLLRDHAGALPLLKLMEIHRRLGHRADYEDVRSRVVRHFNADAPKWQADPRPGRSLEDYPEVLARIEALWATPAAAMQALDALMFRRGPDDAGFDLPAYRELMFLHSIALDRDADTAGAPAARDVDLLLPIGPAVPPTPIARLNATADVAPRQEVRTPAAPSRLRAPIPALPARAGAAFESSETIPSALRRAPGYANESAFVDLELEFPGLPTDLRPS